MPDQSRDKRCHLVLHNTARPLAFTAHTPIGGAPKIVPDLPQQHGQSLQNQLNKLKPVAAAARVQQQQQQQQQQQGLESGLGLQIQFVSQLDVELAFERLANGTKN